MIDTIKLHLKNAMIAKDKERLSAIRNILAKLKAKEIENNKALNKEESLQVLQSMAKQLKDSIEQYINGNRNDLADKESKELDIVKEFLPTPLSQDEIEKIIDETIKECNATSMKDMGKVMGMIISKSEGRGDGSLISQLVKEKLS
tara:strand:- start:2771 stop:3208 length:438 start_codon:yes stop_codon:yes gene_type:complete